MYTKILRIIKKMFYTTKKTLRLRNGKSNSCEWNLQYRTRKVVKSQDFLSLITALLSMILNFNPRTDYIAVSCYHGNT